MQYCEHVTKDACREDNFVDWIGFFAYCAYAHLRVGLSVVHHGLCIMEHHATCAYDGRFT